MHWAQSTKEFPSRVYIYIYIYIYIYNEYRDEANTVPRSLLYDMESSSTDCLIEMERNLNKYSIPKGFEISRISFSEGDRFAEDRRGNQREMGSRQVREEIPLWKKIFTMGCTGSKV